MTTFCRGINIQLPFLSGGIGFSTGNQFVAELSDDQGSFSTPTIIGTISGTSPQGIVSGTLPSDLIESTNYQIRIRSTNSAFTGSSKKVSIFAFKEPTVSITADAGTSVCSNDDVTFTAFPVNGGDSPHYQWKKNNIVTGTDSPVFITNTLLNGDVISCTLTSSFLCASSMYANSNLLTMTVNTIPPIPVISLNGNILSSDASVGNQWYDQNGLINGAISQDYTVTTNGSYYVIVTLSGCSSEKSNTIGVIFTNIDTKEKYENIKIYPNPFSDELIIEVEGNQVKLSFDILNSQGEVILKSYMYEKTRVQTNSYPSGVYILKFENYGQIPIFKIVKNE
jgi:hypothetical protein